MNEDRELLRTLKCRYGRLTFPVFDTTVGKSLEFYGEWGQQELNLLRGLIPVGATVVDAGAYVGSHSLAFSRWVGTNGTVWACEPRPSVFSLLSRNIRQNDIDNVRLLECALGEAPGRLPFPRPDFSVCRNFGAGAVDQLPGAVVDQIEVKTLDNLSLDRLDLLKADVEGMEYEVLRGGLETLERHRPSLYLECSTVEKGAEVLGLLKPLSYRLFLYRPRAFNPENFFGCDRSIFGLEREQALLAVPADRSALTRELAGWQELVPVDSIDELADQLGPVVQLSGEQLVIGSGPARFAFDQVNGYPFDSLPVDSLGRRRISLENGVFFASGWAVAEGQCADAIVVHVGTKSFEADFGFPRPDLAQRHRDRRFLRSGFAFSVPPQLTGDDSLSLEIQVISGDGRHAGTMAPVSFSLA